MALNITGSCLDIHAVGLLTGLPHSQILTVSTRSLDDITILTGTGMIAEALPLACSSFVLQLECKILALHSDQQLQDAFCSITFTERSHEVS